MQMRQNREFVDAKVEIYLKDGSKVLAKLAEYPHSSGSCSRNRRRVSGSEDPLAAQR